jgi:hypothetical protein
VYAGNIYQNRRRHRRRQHLYWIIFFYCIYYVWLTVIGFYIFTYNRVSSRPFDVIRSITLYYFFAQTKRSSEVVTYGHVCRWKLESCLVWFFFVLLPCAKQWVICRAIVYYMLICRFMIIKRVQLI